ncbi:MAG: tetratricopeptide repeat protein, partial [Gammaproteobacteria bacterium]
MAKIKKKKGRIPGASQAPPGDAGQILSVAVQYHQAGRFAPAAEMYRALLESFPDSPQLCNLNGLALHALGQVDTALSFLRKAARLSPTTAKFHYDLGVILQLESRFEQAIDAYRKAVALQPDHGDAWENLGIACLELASFADATEAFDRALKLKPDCANVLTNSAMLQRWLGRHDEAMRLYQAALEKEPTHLLARNKRAGLLLAGGDFEGGWREYAWRLASAGQPEQDKVHYVPKPMWDGQPLNGRKLLVYSEQGIGDEVMFASFMPRLKGLGGECHFLCDPRMVSVYRRSFPGLQVTATGPGEWGTAAEECRCDVRVPIGNLAQHFCRSPQEITGQPYLKPDPERVHLWAERLGQIGGRLKVGISWRGGAQASARRARSVTLDAFAPLLELDDVTFVNLQYGDCRKDIARLPKRLKKRFVCFSDIDPLRDLESFCALMANLDLVITIDNSTVHFAGALGVP